MAKVQIKCKKLTPFGGIFAAMEQFDIFAQTDAPLSMMICSSLQDGKRITGRLNGYCLKPHREVSGLRHDPIKSAV
jgi:hypothetical protein